MHANEPRLARSRGCRLSTFAALLALVAATAGVATAQASAASIMVPGTCVVNADANVGAPMTVTGTGFTPGDTIELQTTSGGGSGTAQAGANGDFTASITAPTLSTSGPATSTFTLTATDLSTVLAATPSTTFRVANLAVSINPAQAKPSQRVTWSFSGFAPGKGLYAHFLHGRKLLFTTLFGRASGPCGTLKTKKLFFPGKPKYNTYNLQFDDARRYSTKSLPHLLASLTTRTPL